MSENIVKGEDGKYRWVYQYNMYKNPTILFTVWKIFGVIIFIMFLFIEFINLMKNDVAPTPIGEIALMFLLIGGLLAVLAAVAYVILALMYGGKYCVVFEMDEVGIMHTQLKKQYSKAQALSALTTLVGVATGNLTTTGIGLTTMTHSSLYSEFAKVKKVKPLKRRHTIKVNAPFSKNQVYCEKEDFDFVLGFIKEHTNCK